MYCIVDVINTCVTILLITDWFNPGPGPGKNDQSRSRLKSLSRSVNMRYPSSKLYLYKANGSFIHYVGWKKLVYQDISLLKLLKDINNSYYFIYYKKHHMFSED